METLKYHKNINFENKINKNFSVTYLYYLTFCPISCATQFSVVTQKGEKKQNGNGKKQECVADSFIFLNKRKTGEKECIISHTKKPQPTNVLSQSLRIFMNDDFQQISLHNLARRQRGKSSFCLLFVRVLSSHNFSLYC